MNDAEKFFVEMAVDEDGNQLWRRPYIFKRLNGRGERIVSDGIHYEVVSSIINREENFVRTILRRIPMRPVGIRMRTPPQAGPSADGAGH
jgi:hypothetical protein